MERQFACKVDELAVGTSMTVKADPMAVALYRTADDEFFATADTCTHEDWSLGSDSDLDGREVVCPLHNARFDIATGKPLCLPATLALQTFAVEVTGDAVYILS
jgi:3-phenylpropionate/trans-cinnamate dioxygenase ferredoxin subunit